MCSCLIVAPSVVWVNPSMAANPLPLFAVTRFLSALGALTILVSACGGGTTDTAVTASDETTAAASTNDDTAAEWPYTFVVDQLDGSTFDAGDYAGQDLVLWFWAPW